MKRILLVFAMLLVGGVALAGWNIQQGSGESQTVWQNETGVRVGVGGGTVITINIPFIDSSLTRYYLVHRPGTIVRAYLTPVTELTGSATPQFHIFVLSQATDQAAIVTVQVTGLNNVTPMASGVLEALTNETVGNTQFQQYNEGNTVKRGNLIAILNTSIGGGTESSLGSDKPDAILTIIIE